MICPQCGSELKQGAVFCDNCGTRIKPHSINAGSFKKGHKTVSPRRRIRVAILVLGIFSIACLVAGLTLFFIYRPDKVGLDDSGNDTSTAINAKETYDQESDWQAVYQSFLEQLIPERMNSDDFDLGVKMTLVDLNFDGIPELLDYYYADNESDDRKLTVYYIDGGCTHILGSASIDGDLDSSKPGFALYRDTVKDDLYFVSIGEFGTEYYCGEEICLWGSKKSPIPYYECMFLQQSCEKREDLLQYSDEAFIQYNASQNAFVSYAFQNDYISEGEYANAENMFWSILDAQDWTVQWYADGYESLTSAGSLYRQCISDGKTDQEAADAVFEQILLTYVPLG